MSNQVKGQEESKAIKAVDNSLLIDEFEIVELEDRLELAGRCNGRCDSAIVDN